jgi:UDP-glucuronate 4-epimerase
MVPIFVATRVHGKTVLRDDPSLEKLEAFIVASLQYASHIGIAVSDAAKDLKLYNAVNAVVARHPSAKISVLYVAQWGAFTPALNALMRHAASLFEGDAHILYQSLEVSCDSRAVQCLRDQLGPSTLVCGAVVDGHSFKQPERRLDGSTCPWNTLALWSLPKLLRTGFLPVSEGTLGAEGGVEEVVAVAAQQRLFPGTSMVVLAKLPDDATVAWGTNFTAADRKAYHARKMASKISRAESQLVALGWEKSPGVVKHVDLRFGNHISASPPAIAEFAYIEPVENFSNLKVLVTGGAGFIGSHTVDRLLRRGNSVVIIDTFNDYYDVQQKEDNITHCRDILAEILRVDPASPVTLHVVRGSICDRKLMDDVFAKHKPELVVHLAARAGVRPSLENPHIYVQTNLAGTTVLLENSRLHGVKHFVFASSSSVYGDSLAADFTEKDDVLSPVSPYAATKKASELMASTFTHLYGLPTSGLRFFTVYGPRGRPDMAPYKFIERAVKGVSMDQYGDGSSERDYTYIDDICDGVVRTLDRPSGYQIYNIGRGTPVTLKKFIGMVATLSKSELIINYMPEQPGDVQRTCADISKARGMLGYDPKTSFEHGLKVTFDWLMGKFARAAEQQRVLDEGKVVLRSELLFDINVNFATGLSSTDDSSDLLSDGLGSPKSTDDGSTDKDMDDDKSDDGHFAKLAAVMERPTRARAQSEPMEWKGRYGWATRCP